MNQLSRGQFYVVCGYCRSVACATSQIAQINSWSDQPITVHCIAQLRDLAAAARVLLAFITDRLMRCSLRSGPGSMFPLVKRLSAAAMRLDAIHGRGETKAVIVLHRSVMSTASA